MRQRGFTLIELLVTIAIVAILAAMAAPSFNETILSNRLASYANSFVASAQLARSEAIKRNTPVTLCRSADSLTCASSGTWQQGWIVMCKYKTTDPNVCVSDGTENLVIAKQQSISADYHFTGDAYTIAFQATGAGATTAALVLCRASPSAGSQERVIAVSVTGRTSVATTRNAVCA